jgi:spore coat protein U-like protein
MYMNIWKHFLLLMVLCMPTVTHAIGVTIPSCTVSTTPLNFGIYWGTTTLTSTARVVVTCNLPATTQVQMDAGLHSLNYVTRKMASQQNTLNYNIYTNAPHTRVWGDGTAGTWTMQGSNITMYGTLPAGQVATPGTYTDTVVVTIIW